jgi:hypothetical protein
MAGPLVVETLAVDPHEPTIRLDTVLANDRLVSPGETIASMAARTGAVGGINGDFFAISQTNEPLGIVIRSGELLRSPDQRAALVIDTQRRAHLGPLGFSGQVIDGSTFWPLTGVDLFPPSGGASLMQPAYGPIPPRSGVTLVELEMTPDEPSTYTVGEILDASEGAGAGLSLAFGPAALAIAPPPLPGDKLEIQMSTEPGFGDAVTALGGGPLYLRDGRIIEDPHPPSPSEALRPSSLSGILTRPDGTLVFVEVDGRDSEYSIGLTRPEFAALLEAFGAVDAMGFDGGGSSTLVARIGGIDSAEVQNRPSDGKPRPVANGLFVYSSATPGPPARLSVRPDRADLLVGARLPLAIRTSDAGGRPLGSPPQAITGSSEPEGLVHVGQDGTLTALRPGSGSLLLQSGSLAITLPVNVLAAPTHLRIDPPRPAVAADGTIRLHAVAVDAAGDPLALPAEVAWDAQGAAIDSEGILHAGTQNATASVRVAGSFARADVSVGARQADLPILDPPFVERWNFATLPRGGPGSLTNDNGLRLSYDFTEDERAAYARTHILFGGTPESIDLEVVGDGHGAALRAGLLDGHGHSFALTLARAIDWVGERRCVANIPTTIAPPITLTELYVVSTLSNPPLHAAGSVVLRQARAVFAGSRLPKDPIAWQDAQ